MKISNSKKQLAQIIHENGGWRDGVKLAAQDRSGRVCFYSAKPTRAGGTWWHSDYSNGDWINCRGAQPNWHQTILSRDEYFHLHPAPDADVAIAASFNPCMDGFDVGGVIAQHTDSLISESNGAQYTPRITAVTTIEQLAADYRNAKDYADRKQQEADAAKADAEAKLAALVAASEALGLVLGVVGVGPEPALVITNWRDLRVGDVVEVTGSDNPGWIRLKGIESLVTHIGPCEEDVIFCPRNNGGGDWTMSDNTEWRFIRRPSKGGGNA